MSSHGRENRNHQSPQSGICESTLEKPSILSSLFCAQTSDFSRIAFWNFEWKAQRHSADGDTNSSGIQIDPTKSEKLLRGLTSKEKSRDLAAEADAQTALVDMDQYHLIADWYYFGILSLVETKDFQGTEEWIAERLGIQLRQARTAITRLERMELLVRGSNGQLKGTGKPIKTSSGRQIRIFVIVIFKIWSSLDIHSKWMALMIVTSVR